MRDKHYGIFAQRLSDENQEWLKKEKKKFKSWNKLFNEIRKKYENKNKTNDIKL